MMKKNKILALVLACIVCVGIGIGGTLAWLTAKTTPVTNTFTVGDINIELKEHEYDPDQKGLKGSETTANDNYKFVPGDTLPKDPFVKVKAGSEACYLFVKVEATNNTVADLTGNVIQWNVDEGTDPSQNWVAVDGHTGYWYRTVPAVASDASTLPTFYVLKSNTVTVNENVTKAMVEGLKSNCPQIIVTAAAVQQDNVADVATAWGKLPTDFTGVTPTP